MTITARVQELLGRTSSVLPVTDQDIIFRGITVELMERVVQLKKAGAEFEEKYGSTEELERQMEERGVSPDDHTLYTDLLEWRAINYEVSELIALLESM
jgi:hypothetical protein